MTGNRFLSAFLSFALVIVGALVTIPTLTWQAAVQLIILGVSTAVTLLLPLVPSSKWQCALKTGSAVALAVLNGLTPLILGGKYDHATIGLIVIAGLQAVASEIGVQVRTASVASAAPVAAAPVVAPVAAPAVVAPVAGS